MNSLRLLLVLSIVLGTIGCAGVGFEKKWEAALAEYDSAKSPDPVAGPWKGTWRTETNGHEGKLRCIATPTDEDSYEFLYHATWFKIFQGGYKVNFEVDKSAGGYLVQGTEDLGLFGTFSHDGKIKGDQFNATYSNQRETQVGEFKMERP